MRGETTMAAGVPNSGKSAIALYASHEWARTGEYVLYFSADSNEATQATRQAAIVTGHPSREIRTSITHGGEDYYADALSDAVPETLRFDFNSNPTLSDIELTMLAYDELFGCYPTICVLDNLMNIEGVSDGDNEKRGLIEIQKTLRYWSREHGVAWLVLHHCSEAEGKPHLPPPRKMIQQKVSELPELILTVAYDDTTKNFGVAAVKNRHDRADPRAADPVFLVADLDRCRFYDNRYQAITAGMAL